MPRPPPMLRNRRSKPWSRIWRTKLTMICAASRKMATRVMVLPRWLCTPTSSTLGSARMRSRNHCRSRLGVFSTVAMRVDGAAQVAAHAHQLHAGQRADAVQEPLPQ